MEFSEDMGLLQELVGRLDKDQVTCLQQVVTSSFGRTALQEPKLITLLGWSVVVMCGCGKVDVGIPVMN